VQIDHISFSKSGGAGIVADLLAARQLELGNDSRLVTVLDGSLSDQPFRHVDLTIRAAVDRYVISKTETPTLTSLARRSGRALNRRLLRPGASLHLHWMEGVLTTADIRDLVENSPSSIWTLHDMAPFTGFCHLSQGCKKFEKDCSGCPQSRSLFQNRIALSFQNHIRELEVLSEKLKIVVPSEWMRVQTEKSKLFQNFDVHMISNPVRPQFFSDRNKISLRSDLGILESEFVGILVASDLDDPNKQVQKAIEAFIASLGYISRSGRLILVGKTHKKSIGLDSRLDFRGTQDAEGLAKLMAAADVILSTSMAESSGLTIAEAAASGTPAIVLANETGSSELVVDQVTGFLSNNWRDFGSLLVKIGLDGAKSSTLGISAREFARINFEATAVALQYLELHKN
jgi:glycosyltransferase involved in cell wall biosynthesis